MTPHLNLSENEWATCGPGSSACLLSIFGPDVRGIESEAIAWLHSTQAEHFARLGITDPPSMNGALPGVSFVDIEHSLCECSKYCRNQDVSGAWEASDEPLTSDLPAKWTQMMEPARAGSSSPMADVTPSPLPEAEEEGEKDWEVSHIVREQTESNPVMYLIRWAGYSPDWDTWASAADLVNAQDILNEWRARGLLKEGIDRKVQELREETNHMDEESG